LTVSHPPKGREPQQARPGTKQNAEMQRLNQELAELDGKKTYGVDPRENYATPARLAARLRCADLGCIVAADRADAHANGESSECATHSGRLYLDFGWCLRAAA
jgi:hypothetical protein